jgi:virginiamycin A acetyltransferase
MMGTNYEIGEGSRVPKDCFFRCKVIIGKHTNINGRIIAQGRGTLIIGNYVAIAEDLRVITSNHKMNYPNLQVALQNRLGFDSVRDVPKDVIIDHATWIGARVIMTPGSGIGVGGIAGAGSIVTKKYPPFAIVAGNPARIIKMRFSDKVIETLLKIKWWEWDEERMSRNRAFFELDCRKIESSSEIEDLIVP